MYIKQYVYIVKRNADTNEGRGPMVVDSIWTDDHDEVAKYIDSKPGVQGRRMKWSRESHGDWTMTRVELKTSYAEVQDEMQETLRLEALNKLSDEEIRALGLDEQYPNYLK